MGARKKPKSKRRLTPCRACGAGVPPGPATCPLCGAELAATSVVPPERAPDDYQEAIRRLRAELQELREDGAA